MLPPKFSDPQSFHDISFLVFRIRVILSGPAARGRRHDSRGGYGFSGREPKIRPDEKGQSREKKNMPGGSAQVFEKARFGQGNPSKSKRFSLKDLAGRRPDLARFGVDLENSALALFYAGALCVYRPAGRWSLLALLPRPVLCASPSPFSCEARAEGWPSGRRRTPGKCVYGKPYRGFESRPLRQALSD